MVGSENMSMDACPSRACAIVSLAGICLFQKRVNYVEGKWSETKTSSNDWPDQGVYRVVAGIHELLLRSQRN